MGKERITTQELVNELQSRLILDLKDNEKPCPTCKGMLFVYKQNGNHGYMETCPDCYNGKVHECKYCGKLNKTDYCNCKQANEERRIAMEKEDSKQQRELFAKAKKVNIKDYYEDYDRYFILDGDNYVSDIDGVYDWLYDKIKYDKLTDEELPKYIWGTEAEPVFDLNIKEIIENECEDGYEDMISHLKMEDDKLDKVQELLDKWYKEQGNSVNTYYEDHSVAVILDDLIKEIRKEIKEESEQNE